MIKRNSHDETEYMINFTLKAMITVAGNVWFVKSWHEISINYLRSGRDALFKFYDLLICAMDTIRQLSYQISSYYGIYPLITGNHYQLRRSKAKIQRKFKRDKTIWHTLQLGKAYVWALFLVRPGHSFLMILSMREIQNYILEIISLWVNIIICRNHIANEKQSDFTRSLHAFRRTLILNKTT